MLDSNTFLAMAIRNLMETIMDIGEKMYVQDGYNTILK
jgi:hypothetical protein